MDRNGESDKKEPLNGLDSSKTALNGEREEECDESQSLLPPKKGGLSKKKSGKPRRKVQWNDSNGDKLAEVLEFQPR
ncbi:OLC1v1019596C1 [Oldenlandia corymbosa var. corymbosa]|uniref:OLC1v1019596C1 n=1 Tax=Oldenlandia corymbosa var. corymbosa TaxID=529605 RepID=A0AAV1EEJ1_OLDCO|nr:OLC1v1019596C1 [Oldenlandia corymbosa var. corymbosa]